MTLFADIAAALEPLLGERFWQEQFVPAHAQFPYATMISEPVVTTSALDGDAAAMAWRSLQQVDLWERADAEDPDLYRAVRSALNGLKLSAPFMRLGIQYSLRIPEDLDTRVVHHAITCRAIERE